MNRYGVIRRTRVRPRTAPQTDKRSYPLRPARDGQHHQIEGRRNHGRPSIGRAYFETADQAIVSSWHSARDKLWQGLSSRYAVYGHIVRRRVAPVIAGEFDGSPSQKNSIAATLSSIADVRLFRTKSSSPSSVARFYAAISDWWTGYSARSASRAAAKSLRSR